VNIEGFKENPSQSILSGLAFNNSIAAGCGLDDKYL